MIGTITFGSCIEFFNYSLFKHPNLTWHRANCNVHIKCQFGIKHLKLLVPLSLSLNLHLVHFKILQLHTVTVNKTYSQLSHIYYTSSTVTFTLPSKQKLYCIQNLKNIIAQNLQPIIVYLPTVDLYKLHAWPTNLLVLFTIKLFQVSENFRLRHTCFYIPFWYKMRHLLLYLYWQW